MVLELGPWLAVFALTVFPVGGWFVDAVEEDEGARPAEVVELGGEDFDAVVVGQWVDGAEEGVEGTVFLDEFEDALSVGDGGFDLAAVAHQSGVGLEAFEVGGFRRRRPWLDRSGGRLLGSGATCPLMTRQLKPERKMALVSSSRYPASPSGVMRGGISGTRGMDGVTPGLPSRAGRGCLGACR